MARTKKAQNVKRYYIYDNKHSARSLALADSGLDGGRPRAARGDPRPRLEEGQGAEPEKSTQGHPRRRGNILGGLGVGP